MTTASDKKILYPLLHRVQELQTKYWDGLADLEAELGIDLDSTRDFTELTVEDLIEEAEEDPEEERE